MVRLKFNQCKPLVFLPSISLLQYILKQMFAYFWKPYCIWKYHQLLWYLFQLRNILLGMKLIDYCRLNPHIVGHFQRKWVLPTNLVISKSPKLLEPSFPDTWDVVYAWVNRILFNQTMSPTLYESVLYDPSVLEIFLAFSGWYEYLASSNYVPNLFVNL